MQRIWIDLDNTPHVPLFVPVIRELRNRGYPVVVTARDAFQVKELADYYHLSYRLVGRHFGKKMSLKLIGLGWRAVQLLPTAIWPRPSLSISHGSRSQLVASALLGIPSLMIADYEHARTWAGIRPTWVMVPDVIPYEAVRTDRRRVLRYPGIKEDVYVPFFKPDITTRARLGLNEDDVVALVRPPATEAHYHNPASEALFRELVGHLARADTRMIVLPRNAAQGAAIQQEWADLFALRRIIIPAKVEDGLNLIWCSDFVVSGGGTMNREAAALHVPVYSIFRGPTGAVDRALEAQGRLTMLSSIDDLRSRLIIERRKREPNAHAQGSRALETVVTHVEQILNPTAGDARGSDV